MATTAQINAAYDALLPLIKRDIEAVVPGIFEGRAEAALMAPAGVKKITGYLGVAIDAAARVKT